MWRSIVLAILVAACTTTVQDKGIEETEHNIVVQKPGSKLPVISRFGSKHWITMRRSNASELKKAYGHLAIGDWQNASLLAKAYLQSSPGNLDAMTVLAASLAMGQRFHMASYYASLVEKYRPNDTNLLNIKGLAIMMDSNNQIDDFYRAARFFQTAMDINGTDVASGLNLGHLYLELADSQRATYIFRETARRCRDCTPALLGYAIAASRMGGFREARSALKRILKRWPDHVQAKYQLAYVEKNGFRNLDDAEDLLREALAENDESNVVMRQEINSLLRQVVAELDADDRRDDSVYDGNGLDVFMTGYNEEED